MKARNAFYYAFLVASLVCVVDSATLFSKNAASSGPQFTSPSCSCYETRLLDIQLLPTTDTVRTSMKESWNNSVLLMGLGLVYCPERAEQEDDLETAFENNGDPEHPLMPEDEGSRMQRVLEHIEKELPRCNVNIRRMGLAVSMANCYADFGECFDSKTLDPNIACVGMKDRVIAALVGKVDKKYVPCVEDCEYFITKSAGQACNEAYSVNLCTGLPASGSGQCVTDQELLKEFQKDLRGEADEDTIGNDNKNNGANSTFSLVLLFILCLALTLLNLI